MYLVYVNKIHSFIQVYKIGTAYCSRALGFSPDFLVGVHVFNDFSFCVAFFVLSSFCILCPMPSVFLLCFVNVNLLSNIGWLVYGV